MFAKFRINETEKKRIKKETIKERKNYCQKIIFLKIVFIRKRFLQKQNFPRKVLGKLLEAKSKSVEK